MEILPAIDILDGKAVRLLRGDYHEVTVYGDRPEEVAEEWARAGAARIHVVDLEAARGGVPQRDVVGRIAGRSAPIQVGGGVRTADDAERLIDDGAERVVVGSALVDPSPEAAEAIVDRIGGGAVVGAIDVRNGRALGHGWRGEGSSLDDIVVRCAMVGIERVLVTGIEVDGTMEGPSLEVVDAIRLRAPSLSIIASGGVGALDDIRTLAGRGDIEGVIVGRALYEGRFTVTDAVAAASA